MADRIGVIRKGEVILVEDKTTLMQKFGRKQLILQLQDRIDALPPGLPPDSIELSGDGQELTYTFDARREDTGVAALLRQLSAAGIEYRDLQTRQSSLEDIFMTLVGAR